jgi:peptidoglycan hydrolase-like protein with peptidoglycan-binding domain
VCRDEDRAVGGIDAEAMDVNGPAVGRCVRASAAVLAPAPLTAAATCCDDERRDGGRYRTDDSNQRSLLKLRGRPSDKTAVRHLAISIVTAVVLAPSAFGARGDADVAALQVGLKARGLYTGPIDGLHGPATSAAVRRLTGPAVPPAADLSAWRLRLGAYGRFTLGTRVLRPGVSGWDVAAFKFLLAWRGFPSGPLEAHYTQRTATAVRKFQLSVGLAADGAAGPATIAAARLTGPQPPSLALPPVALEPSGWFGPRGSRFHSGIDYPTPTGTTVAAAARGRVSFAGWDGGGYGYLVTIDHGGGLHTMYAHLSRVAVRVGQPIAAGATLGRSGASGLSDGPHLHFEVRLGGAAVDPLSALPDAHRH